MFRAAGLNCTAGPAAAAVTMYAETMNGLDSFRGRHRCLEPLA